MKAYHFATMKTLALSLGVVAMILSLAACANVQPIGIIYTNMCVPLTENLHSSPMTPNQPTNGQTMEIKEPFTGFGLYARVGSNAIGDIARRNGMQTLYYADQQRFSILGVWTTVKTILHGE